MLDNYSAADLRMPEWLWVILHKPGDAPFWKLTVVGADGAPATRELTFGTGYCLIPWLGVMAAGYGFGSLLTLDRGVRRGILFVLGTTLTLIFIRLRLTNVVGDADALRQAGHIFSPLSFDPQPWSKQPRGDLFTVLSFLNCTKYPASLLYILMTLGPAIMALALFDRPLGPLARPLITFGRVPLFYYLLHIPLVHGGAVLLDHIRFGWSPQSFSPPWAVNERTFELAPNYGVSLWAVYLIWIAVVFILYWPCRWWAGVKQRHRHWLLSYL
jgi:uncharacterized membrane protein